MHVAPRFSSGRRHFPCIIGRSYLPTWIKKTSPRCSKYGSPITRPRRLLPTIITNSSSSNLLILYCGARRSSPGMFIKYKTGHQYYCFLIIIQHHFFSGLCQSLTFPPPTDAKQTINKNHGYLQG